MKLRNQLRMLLKSVAVLIAGCAFQLQCYAIDGRVIDKVTNLPIEGALVVVSWNASSYGLQCVHAEVASTGVDGRYRIGNWMGPWYAKYLVMSDKFISYGAYKIGYAHIGDLQTTEDKIFLTPFTGTKSAWMESWRNGGFFCLGNKDGSDSNLYPIISSIATDMEAIAQTDRQRDIAEFIRQRADGLAGNRSERSGESAVAAPSSGAGIRGAVIEPRWMVDDAAPTSEPQSAPSGPTPHVTYRRERVETPLSVAPPQVMTPPAGGKP